MVSPLNNLSLHYRIQTMIHVLHERIQGTAQDDYTHRLLTNIFKTDGFRYECDTFSATKLFYITQGSEEVRGTIDLASYEDRCFTSIRFDMDYGEQLYIYSNRPINFVGKSYVTIEYRSKFASLRFVVDGGTQELAKAVKGLSKSPLITLILQVVIEEFCNIK